MAPLIVLALYFAILGCMCNLQVISFNIRVSGNSWMRRTSITIPTHHLFKKTKLLGKRVPYYEIFGDLPPDPSPLKYEEDEGEKVKTPQELAEEKEIEEAIAYLTKDERADNIISATRTEDNDGIEMDGSSKLGAMRYDQTPIQIELDTLADKWTEYLTDKNETTKVDAFSLKKVIPLLMNPSTRVELINSTRERIEAENVPVQYITEAELQRLWKKNSLRALAKPESQYSTEEALMLLGEDEMDKLLGFAEEEEGDTTGDEGIEGETSEVEEVIVTEQELRRTWEKRSRIPWGMPSPEFDLKNSLLLLDSDQEISDDTEIVEEGTDVSISDIYSTDGSEIFSTDGVNQSIDMSGQKTSLLTTGSSSTENDNNDSSDYNDKPKKYVMRPPKRITVYELHQKITDGFVFDREKEVWMQYKGRGLQGVRNAVKKAMDAIDRPPEITKGWRGGRQGLFNPDIDHQQGDVLFGNTYLTTRIPANWNDPDAVGQSAEYNMTATMALPGEPQTDYNNQPPIWELLGLRRAPGNYPAERTRAFLKNLPATIKPIEMRVPMKAWKYRRPNDLVRDTVYMGASGGSATGMNGDIYSSDDHEKANAEYSSGSSNTYGDSDCDSAKSSSTRGEVNWDYFDFAPSDAKYDRSSSTYPPLQDKPSSVDGHSANNNGAVLSASDDLDALFANSDNNPTVTTNTATTASVDSLTTTTILTSATTTLSSAELAASGGSPLGISTTHNSTLFSVYPDSRTDRKVTGDALDQLNTQHSRHPDAIAAREAAGLKNALNKGRKGAYTDTRAIKNSAENVAVPPQPAVHYSPDHVNPQQEYLQHNKLASSDVGNLNRAVYDDTPGPVFYYLTTINPYTHYDTINNVYWTPPPQYIPETTQSIHTQHAVHAVPLTTLHTTPFLDPNAELFKDSELRLFEEDQLFAEACLLVQNITDMYLNSHDTENRDNEKFLRRYFANKLLNLNDTNEAIPMHWTPDLNRGVNYTDELLELKGKITLAPWQPEPRVAFANDSFGYNTDTMAMNTVGTCRDQYDWLPRTDLVHEVEMEKVPFLQPVIDFVNFAGELVSTKDDIIIFNYLGTHIRHIIGIRASMLHIAKQCYPQIKDLRLESPVLADKFDTT